MTNPDPSIPAPAPRALGGGRRRLFGGYGPLLAIVVTFLLIATLAPTVAPEQLLSVPGGPGTEFEPSDGQATATTIGGGGNSPGAVAGATVEQGAGQGAIPSAPGAATGPCADREIQIPGDPYSPPCIAFEGDNGGATHRGVSADTIRIGFRIPIEDIRDYQSLVGDLTAGAERDIPVPTEEDVRRSADAMVEYFNRNFQLYGRKIEMVEWKGQGSVINEVVGAGQEAANADAIRAATELDIFADISGFTQPYSDALARQGVIAIGVPYLSREWFQERAPFAWSIFPDCTIVADTIAEYLNKRVYPYPAGAADGSLANKPRKVGIIAPDNPEYQQCADRTESGVNDGGNNLSRYSYTLDLSTLSDQANNLAARLRSDGITTIALTTDPLLPLLLTARLGQQDYYPEWLVSGAGLTDLDVVGQLYDPVQWSNAFGFTYFAEQQPVGSSYAYHAFKSIHPDAEPIFGIEGLYYFMYLLTIGLHMAGPNLTPETFAAGMHAYPGGSGPAGTWGFPDGEFTPYRDSREIRWDPDAVSVFNSQPGAYVSDQTRYGPGQWPAADPLS